MASLILIILLSFCVQMSIGVYYPMSISDLRTNRYFNPNPVMRQHLASLINLQRRSVVRVGGPQVTRSNMGMVMRFGKRGKVRREGPKPLRFG